MYQDYEFDCIENGESPSLCASVAWEPRGHYNGTSKQQGNCSTRVYLTWYPPSFPNPSIRIRITESPATEHLSVMTTRITAAATIVAIAWIDSSRVLALGTGGYGYLFQSTDGGKMLVDSKVANENIFFAPVLTPGNFST